MSLDQCEGPQFKLAKLPDRSKQLECALSRVTETLLQRNQELQTIRASQSFRAGRALDRLFNQLFPILSLRRAALGKVVKNSTAWLKKPKKSLKEWPASFKHYECCTPLAEYERFITAMEPSAADLKKQAKQPHFNGPLFSLVMPLAEPLMASLIAAVHAVRTQTYSKWELCITYSKHDLELRNCLVKLASGDDRIILHGLDQDQGLVAKANAAIAMASGQYIGLLHQSDILARSALYEISQAIKIDPIAEMLYCDEDKIDGSGMRFEPHFKPAWSPETLLSLNYIGRFAVVARPLLERVGTLNSEFDGAHEHDFFMRAGSKAKSVIHVPQVLYHVRVDTQSEEKVAASRTAHTAGKLAVAAHLGRDKIDAVVHDGSVPGIYRIEYILTNPPKVSVLVPNRDQCEMLKRCVESVLQCSYTNLELIIIENGSQEPITHAYYQELSTNPKVRIIEWNEPFNYAAANNFGAKFASGEYFLFLNNDVEAMHPSWLGQLVQIAVQQGIGAVGAKLYYDDFTIQHAGVVVGMGGVAGHSHLSFPGEVHGYMHRLTYPQNVSAVTGACLMTSREAFERVDGFDEGYALAFNDVDLCLKILSANYRIVWTPHAELYHLESKTRGYEDTPEKQRRFQSECRRFQQKWRAFLESGDPYYNANFRLDRSDYSLVVSKSKPESKAA